MPWGYGTGVEYARKHLERPRSLSSFGLRSTSLDHRVSSTRSQNAKKSTGAGQRRKPPAPPPFLHLHLALTHGRLIQPGRKSWTWIWYTTTSVRRRKPTGQIQSVSSLISSIPQGHSIFQRRSIVLRLTKSLRRLMRMTTLLNIPLPVSGERFLFVARSVLLTKHCIQHPEVRDSVSIRYRILRAVGARRGRRGHRLQALQCAEPEQHPCPEEGSRDSRSHASARSTCLTNCRSTASPIPLMRPNADLAMRRGCLRS